MEKIALDMRRQNLRIGFVPTMGFLHAGHLSLVQKAREQNDRVVVSIFVNPTQFGPNEDLAKYPRDLERDRAFLAPFSDYLFIPMVEQMYGRDEKINFRIKSLNEVFCGPFRPGHFEGVAQVLTKLFHLVQPHRAYFGQKDYQQVVIVRELVPNFFFPLEVMMEPTVREADGLAMSSRNVYLNPEERKLAPALYQGLQFGIDLLQKGEQDPMVIVRAVKDFLQKKGFQRLDYVELCRAKDLAAIRSLKEERAAHEPLVLAAAVYLGATRLIDNLLYET